jgi:hypothetical protein
MSKTDATPEKQNRQVAREKSYRAVTDAQNLFNLLLLKTWVKLARHSSFGSLYPLASFGPPWLHSHQECANESAEIGMGLVGG